MKFLPCLKVVVVAALFQLGAHSNPALAAERTSPVYPATHWDTRAPEALGLSREKLDALSVLAGGRGCVVRHGYMAYTWGDQAKSSDIASAMKPVISTLLFIAIQEGKLAGVDQKVADFDPRLKSINKGKDAAITWRHLASQTSGYGLAEPPGEAYSYNDFAIALYYDTLTEKVFTTNGTEVLRTRLAGPLQFEDNATFNAFGPTGRAGRLALSVRDFARLGLLYLRQGRWRDQQLLQPEFIRMALDSPIPASIPLTSGREAEMLPGQRTLGGGKNITPVGPGYYSFNWWLNRTNQSGQRLFVDAPSDTYVASGHGGKRVLSILPDFDLLVCWNDSRIDDHDKSPGNRTTKCNQAVKLMVEAVVGERSSSGSPEEIPADQVHHRPSSNDPSTGRMPAALSRTDLGINNTQFTLNGEARFLLGISYYGALGASEGFILADLADMKHDGFNWLRVWANWSAFDNDVSAVDGEGGAREPFLSKLKWLVALCDQRGLIVDVTLSRGNGITGPSRLQTTTAHRRAVETLVTSLRPWRNWYLDLSNERNIRDQRYTSFDELKEFRAVVRNLDPLRLVTASHAGDLTVQDLQRYMQSVHVDFISPHRPRTPGSPPQTGHQTGIYLESMKNLARLCPVHYQEPFRRGYGKWEPMAADFLTDVHQARGSGAAGWCLHNGDQRAKPDGQPRRSFDLRAKRLYDQLDDQERKVIEGLRAEFMSPPQRAK